MRFRPFIVLALVTIGVGSAMGQHPQDNRPSFSETQGGGFDTPAFDLPDLYGSRHSPSSYQGQAVLLYFMGHD